jgi:hypothetical protein
VAIRGFILLAVSASALVGAGLLVSQVSQVTETGDEAGRGAASQAAADGFTTNAGAMQSIRGIKGIDTVMLQNLEAVLRMQAPPPPPEAGGGGGARTAAALLTMESDAPPDPEIETDDRQELTELELEGS